jgi:hypothetical protein
MLGKIRHDLGRTLQRSTHRASLSYLHESLPLIARQVPGQPDRTVEAIYRVASTGRANTLVAQFDRNLVERPLVPVRKHSNRHGGASTECGQQVFVWRWAGIVTAKPLGFVLSHYVVSRRYELRVRSVSALFHDNCVVDGVAHRSCPFSYFVAGRSEKPDKWQTFCGA